MTKDTKFEELLDGTEVLSPQVGDIIKGVVLSASKSAVKLDINGIMVGIVRGRELYREAPEYANLQVDDEVEATVIDVENENGELELSFSYAGHQKAWDALTKAYEEKEVIIVKVKEANKGGLVVTYGQIVGFLPVSQLSPENYPRVSGGDKTKILEKLHSFIGKDTDVKIMDLLEKEEKLIVSEKMAWSEKQKDVIAKYKPGSVVDGTITAITHFGAFISFGENLEGLIHISELAWQRIENPADIVKVGQSIKAEIINIDGAKIFLSAKKLIADPWLNVRKKYDINTKVEGLVLKTNPFGLFVKLDDDIHALAHISSLDLKEGKSIEDEYKAGKEYSFYVISMEPSKHRLGLGIKEVEKVSKEKIVNPESSDGASSKQVDNGEEVESEDKKTIKQKNKEEDKPTVAKAMADKQENKDDAKEVVDDKDEKK